MPKQKLYEGDQKCPVCGSTLHPSAPLTQTSPFTVERKFMCKCLRTFSERWTLQMLQGTSPDNYRAWFTEEEPEDAT